MSYSINAVDMARAIEAAMRTIYRYKKHVDLPSIGGEDREILFLAISQGILDYLKEKEVYIVNQVTLRDTSTNYTETYTLDNLVLNFQAWGG